MNESPNILLITWHDAGRWFGCYGNENVDTPNVDQLAAEGCRFSNCISFGAICSPSRAAIATGKYGQNNGVIYLTNTVNENRIHRDEMHLAKRLKHEHGYYSALFGIQHECAHEHVTEVIDPDERFLNDPWRDCLSSAAKFAEWLPSRKGEERPFFAQIGFFEAHLNNFYSGGNDNSHYFQESYDEKGLHIPPYLEDCEGTRSTVANLQGLLRRGDKAIGQILEALKTNGCEEDTIVVMCVDHGVGLPRAKASCYDPGIAVSWIMRYPGTIPGGTVVDTLTSQIDTMPTLFDLAGLAVPRGLEGASFAEHTLGESSEEQHDAVFSAMVENMRSLRTCDFKLIRNFRENSKPAIRAIPGRKPIAKGPEMVQPHLELYDLKKDPDEFYNVIDDPDYVALKEQLDAQLWDFLLDHNDFLVNEPVNTPWEKETRKQLQKHCEKFKRILPEIDC